MFTFSFQHFNQLSAQKIELPELLEILNLQGLEVKKVMPFETDTAITIEVKANRSFCLSYLGLLREVAAFKKHSAPDLFSGWVDMPSHADQFPLAIVVKSKKGCSHFAAVILKDINNNVKTPENIVRVLAVMGVNSVNPVVDLLNLIMFETGQPLHAYDLSKIKNRLTIQINKTPKKALTLKGDEIFLQRGEITIEDERDVLSVAGIIGTKIASVTEKTTSILIEAACFNEVLIRLAARNLKISTPSVLRFERGIDATQITSVLWKCKNALIDVVGGVLHTTMYYFGKDEKKQNKIFLSSRRVNEILGVNLTTNEIASCLSQYYFSTTIMKSFVRASVPAYRLDIKNEIDLIGEVARIYGYHHIQPTLPKLPTVYIKNNFREKYLQVRSVLLGLGFDEVIAYSFIPQASLQILGIQNDALFGKEIVLQNPLSQDFALMRPTLLFSLMQSMAYNYSIGNKNLGLFEINKIYFSDSTQETCFKEPRALGLLFTGVHIDRGFGLMQDIKYGFYDINNFLNLILREMDLSFTLKNESFPFFIPQSSFVIEVKNKKVGYAGQVNPAIWNKILNGKLISTPSFFFELHLDCLEKDKRVIASRLPYPAIIREYNFWLNKKMPAACVEEVIKQTSTLIQSIVIKDVYEGKGVSPDKKAILFVVKYVHPHKTLLAEEVVAIEMHFLKKLDEQGIKLGQ